MKMLANKSCKEVRWGEFSRSGWRRAKEVQEGWAKWIFETSTRCELYEQGGWWAKAVGLAAHETKELSSGHLERPASFAQGSGLVVNLAACEILVRYPGRGSQSSGLGI